MKNRILVVIALLGLVSPQFLIAEGKALAPMAIEFLVEQDGLNPLAQTALIKDGMVSVRKVGGNRYQDILFDASANTLFIIDHSSKQYYKIDQGLIDRAGSLIDSISSAVGTQKNVLSDLLGTLGVTGETDKSEIHIKDTGRILSASDIPCRLFYAFRDKQLESEVCLAPRQSLDVLGEHYQTLNTFYVFGDQLLNRAGGILSGLGMAVPAFPKIDRQGLPVLLYIVEDKIKSSLTKIQVIEEEQVDMRLPEGYTQAEIPFIG